MKHLALIFCKCTSVLAILVSLTLVLFYSAEESTRLYAVVAAIVAVQNLGMYTVFSVVEKVYLERIQQEEVMRMRAVSAQAYEIGS